MGLLQVKVAFSKPLMVSFQCQVIMPLEVRGLAHFTPHLTQNMPLNGGHLSMREWVFPQPYVIRRPALSAIRKQPHP